MGLNLYCVNPDCRWHTELRGGGRFLHFKSGPQCEDCSRIRWEGNPGKDLHSFTTTNFNGERIEVKGLAHLRQLEKQFGVSSVTANQDSRNWDRN